MKKGIVKVKKMDMKMDIKSYIMNIFKKLKMK